MAKVTGPLMSLEASGSVYGALTFAKWKGRQYVRSLVIPANPKTYAQLVARNAMRVAAYAQAGIRKATKRYPGEHMTDVELWAAAAPSGQAWNGYMVKTMIGPGALNFQAAASEYGNLDEDGRDAWQGAALNVIPGITMIPQAPTTEGERDSVDAGFGFFVYCYAASLALGRPTPGAVPPSYTSGGGN